MATKTLFIDYAHLVKNTPIKGTVNEAMVDSILPMVQDMTMEPILGTTLYNKLKSDIEATLTVSGDYKTLLDDYINPCLVWWCTSNLIPYMTFSFSNKGLVEQGSDNSTPIDTEKILRVTRQTKSSAEWYSQRLIDYLCANTDLFPEYSQSLNDDDIAPKNSGYSSPFYIPGRSGNIKTYDRGNN